MLERTDARAREIAAGLLLAALLLTGCKVSPSRSYMIVVNACIERATGAFERATPGVVRECRLVAERAILSERQP